MKRQYRVKTGIVVPSRPSQGMLRVRRAAERYVDGLKKLPPNNWQEIGFAQAPLVPLIRCTMPKPCGTCWYCSQATR